MDYITSRGFVLPESAEEFADRFWFNLWRIRLWPYREVVVGDLLYWYESPSKSIVWKSRVTELERFHYDNKDAVRERLVSRFGDFDTTQPYFVEAPEQGYCLAWRAKPLQRVSLSKPENLQFPQQGWLRIDEKVAIEWLFQSTSSENVTLDKLVPKGTLIERLHKLNDAMAEVSPERIRSIVSQTVRRDTQLVKALKELCDFRCQFPGCGVKIPKRGGGFYIEVAHIQPLSKGGSSVLGNLLVLCPNHHKEFDYGDLKIFEQKVEHIRGKLNDKEFEIRLPGDSIIA
jgi:hypothetical protein